MELKYKRGESINTTINKKKIVKGTIIKFDMDEQNVLIQITKRTDTIYVWKDLDNIKKLEVNNERGRI